MQNFEKEVAFDHQIVDCIIEGSKIEQERKLKETPLTHSKSTYKGTAMYLFLFVRVSPRLMIVYCALNTGVARLLSQYNLVLLQQVLFGVLLGVFVIYFGGFVFSPYRRINQIVGTEKI